MSFRILTTNGVRRSEVLRSKCGCMVLPVRYAKWNYSTFDKKKLNRKRQVPESHFRDLAKGSHSSQTHAQILEQKASQNMKPNYSQPSQVPDILQTLNLDSEFTVPVDKNVQVDEETRELLDNLYEDSGTTDTGEGGPSEHPLPEKKIAKQQRKASLTGIGLLKKKQRLHSEEILEEHKKVNEAESFRTTVTPDMTISDVMERRLHGKDDSQERESIQFRVASSLRSSMVHSLSEQEIKKQKLEAIVEAKKQKELDDGYTPERLDAIRQKYEPIPNNAHENIAVMDEELAELFNVETLNDVLHEMSFNDLLINCQRRNLKLPKKSGNFDKIAYMRGLLRAYFEDDMESDDYFGIYEEPSDFNINIDYTRYFGAIPSQNTQRKAMNARRDQNSGKPKVQLAVDTKNTSTSKSKKRNKNRKNHEKTVKTKNP